MKNDFSLINFVQLDILRTIQNSFSTATGIAAVFGDEYGNELGEGANYSRFCSKLHSHEKGINACKLSNYLAGQKTKKLQKPFIYKCHAGLIDIAVPIIVNSQYLGTMMAGQVKCLDTVPPYSEELPSYYNWSVDPEYSELFKEIEFLPRQRIEAIAHTLFIVVNYIVEKKILEIAQETVNKQKEQLIQEIKTRAELENSLKEAELMALQNQINPHFMFNILSTINRLIGLEQYDKAQKVLDAFTKMLRSNLHDIRKILPLERELDYIKRYLYIQNIRFRDRILYQIEVEPSLLQFQIPFFTLQPLIENAIVHGLEPKEGGGKLFLFGEKTKRGYKIKINDTGLGMTTNQLNTIMLNLKSGKALGKDVGHIGIYNVYKRLSIYMGENNFRFKIKSVLNKGTSISLEFLIQGV